MRRIQTKFVVIFVLMALVFLTTIRGQLFWSRVNLNSALVSTFGNVFQRNTSIGCFTLANIGVGPSCTQNHFAKVCPEIRLLSSALTEKDLDRLNGLDIPRAIHVQMIGRVALNGLATEVDYVVRSVNSQDIMLSFMLGNFQLALEKNEGYVQLSKLPNSSRYYVNLGKEALLEKEYDQALRCFITAQNITSNPLALSYLGDTYLLLGDFERALESFEALSEFGRDRVSISATGWPTARFLASKGIGEIAFLEKNWAKAIDAYGDALAIDDTNPTVFMRIAWALYQQTGDMDEALRFNQRAIDLDQHSIWPNITAGKIYHAEERLDEARVAYESAVRIDAQSGLARSYLAQVLFEQDRKHLAIAELEKVVALDPQNGNYRARLCRWYTDLNMMSKYQAACEHQ